MYFDCFNFKTSITRRRPPKVTCLASPWRSHAGHVRGVSGQPRKQSQVQIDSPKKFKRGLPTALRRTSLSLFKRGLNARVLAHVHAVVAVVLHYLILIFIRLRCAQALTGAPLKLQVSTRKRAHTSVRSFNKPTAFPCYSYRRWAAGRGWPNLTGEIGSCRRGCNTGC